DVYLPRLLVHGARAVMRWHGKTSPWRAGLLKRRPFNVAVVALANKLARIAWAVMARGENYRKPAVTAEPATGWGRDECALGTEEPDPRQNSTVLAPARPGRLRRWPWRASLAVRCARRSW